MEARFLLLRPREGRSIGRLATRGPLLHAWSAAAERTSAVRAGIAHVRDVCGRRTRTEPHRMGSQRGFEPGDANTPEHAVDLESSTCVVRRRGRSTVDVATSGVVDVGIRGEAWLSDFGARKPRRAKARGFRRRDLAIILLAIIYETANGKRNKTKPHPLGTPPATPTPRAPHPAAQVPSITTSPGSAAALLALPSRARVARRAPVPERLPERYGPGAGGRSPHSRAAVAQVGGTSRRRGAPPPPRDGTGGWHQPPPRGPCPWLAAPLTSAAGTHPAAALVMGTVRGALATHRGSIRSPGGLNDPVGHLKTRGVAAQAAGDHPVLDVEGPRSHDRARRHKIPGVTPPLSWGCSGLTTSDSPMVIPRGGPNAAAG